MLIQIGRGVLVAVYALSDLHLALSIDKPMDVFGGRWNDYMERIKENWNSTVSDTDTVIVGGDVSWAMYLADCDEDFSYIHNLNGRKIISKGNHDYWWDSLTKLNKYISDNGFSSISFLHNNSYIIENYAICGTRGWINPGENSLGDDRKIYDRELCRLELSASDMENRITQSDKTDYERVAVLHYPPVLSDGNIDTHIEAILKKFNITKCIYGHLHGASCDNSFNREHNGIKYQLVSSDYMKFQPYNLNF